MSGHNPRPVIGIIGGGFTGAVAALHLAELVDTASGRQDVDTEWPDAPARPSSARSLDIVVFEPRTQLGAGLAYDTKQAVHRINVPAERMSAYPADPESFTRWLIETDALADDPDAFSAQGVPFPRREIFGRYMAAQLSPLLASGIIRHERTTVSDVLRDGDGWIVKDADGRTLKVDVLILAVSHPSPSLPRSLKEVSTHPKLVADATQPDALAAIGPEDRVLVVGNGLTAADVIAALRTRGHTGQITALSRRGLRSRGHPTSVQEAFGDFLSEPSSRASHLLHRVRLEIARAAEAGLSWHAVLDALRAQAQSIWKNLSHAERQRIVRHVRPYWDVHRFRIAPQVEQMLDEAISDGSLSIVAASISVAALHEQGVRLQVHERRTLASSMLDVDAVVVTTGPGHGSILQSQPFLAKLAAEGLLVNCPTGLGILNDGSARAVTAGGDHLRTLFIAGPLARGTVGELMGLPQVSEHAVMVARNAAQALKATASISN